MLAQLKWTQAADKSESLLRADAKKALCWPGKPHNLSGVVVLQLHEYIFPQALSQRWKTKTLLPEQVNFRCTFRQWLQK